MITMTMMLTIQDNGDVSDNGWAAATISAIFLPGLLGGNLDYDGGGGGGDYDHGMILLFAEAIVYLYSYLHGDLEGSRGAQLRWT